MLKYSTHVIVNSNGRITLPAKVREQLGVKDGDLFRLVFEGGKIILELR